MSTAAPIRAAQATATTFDDFYFRPNLQADNTIPSAGPYTTCPDIIPAGTVPVANYQTALATVESYTSPQSNVVMQGFDNYLYVRGKNGGSSALNRQVSLYYAPSSVIQWPSQWVQNQIGTDAGNATSLVTGVAPGAIAVAPDTFVWRAVEAPPAGSDHYCLFSYSTDPANPQPLPGSGSMTYEDMGTLIQTQLNIGWLNTVLVDANAPSWTTHQMLTIPANVGGPKTVHVYLQCTGFQGAAVSFQGSSSTGASGPITIPQTTIPTASYIVGTTVTLQPGFATSLTVNFWLNGAQPQSGASISLESAYDEPASDLETVERITRSGLVREHYVAALQDGVGITPSTPVYLGRMKFKVK